MYLESYEKICACVGQLYLEYQRTLSILNEQKNILSEKDRYIMDLENRIKELMDGDSA